MPVFVRLCDIHVSLSLEKARANFTPWFRVWIRKMAVRSDVLSWDMRGCAGSGITGSTVKALTTGLQLQYADIHVHVRLHVLL